MNKIIIPSIFVAVLLVGITFAFMPVQQASTVHTTIQQNTARIDTDSITKTTVGAGADVTITCPSTSDGCHILEVYFDDEDTDADNETVTPTAVVAGESITLATTTTTDGANDAVALNGVSGLAIGPGDSIQLDITGGGNINYTVKAVVQLQGGTSVALS